MKRYKIEYSKTAIRDLDRVWSEVFEVSQNHDIAIKYIDDLMDTIESLTNRPKSGSPLYYENSFTGYYFVVFKSYMAFYRLEKDAMLVDRILYGKSDYIRCLCIAPKETH